MNVQHMLEKLELVEKRYRLQRAQLKDAVDLLNRCRDHMDADTSPYARTLRQDIWKFLKSIDAAPAVEQRCYMCKKPAEKLDGFGLCPECAVKITRRQA